MRAKAATSTTNSGAAGEAAPKQAKVVKLTSPPQGFRRAVGVTGACHDGSVGNRERGNAGDGVEIGSAYGVAYPEALLTGGLKTRIVAFTFGTQGVNALEAETFTVNGKPIIVWNSFVFGTAAVLLSVVPVSVVAGALPGLGATKRTAEFLT